MEPDELKQAWRDHETPGRLRVDANLLREEVRSRQRAFAATIFWRDVREVGVCLVLIPIWIYLGLDRSLHWTWYLMVPALLWIAAYLLADRKRPACPPPEPEEPLRRHVEASLGQVERQIRLLRTVFWWYISPIILAKSAFLGQEAWRGREGGWWMLVAVSEVMALGIVVASFVYWLNHYAIRADLEPRRRELEAMLASLGEEKPDVGG